LAFASTVTIAFTVEASTGPVSRIRAPLANSAWPTSWAIRRSAI
jgi:hypothetical protein